MKFVWNLQSIIQPAGQLANRPASQTAANQRLAGWLAKPMATIFLTNSMQISNILQRCF